MLIQCKRSFQHLSCYSISMVQCYLMSFQKFLQTEGWSVQSQGVDVYTSAFPSDRIYNFTVEEVTSCLGTFHSPLSTWWP